MKKNLYRLLEGVSSTEEDLCPNVKPQENSSPNVEHSSRARTTPNLRHYADKSTLRKDERKGRLYGNWQRSAHAACSFRAVAFVLISDVEKTTVYKGLCSGENASKEIVEIESKGPIYL